MARRSLPRHPSLPFLDFLYPSLAIRAAPFTRTRSTCLFNHRSFTAQSQIEAIAHTGDAAHTILHLPFTCGGCGALTQDSRPKEPGFYDANRKSVKAYLAAQGKLPGNPTSAIEARIFDQALNAADQPLRDKLDLVNDDGVYQGHKDKEHEGKAPLSLDQIAAPICDRCHRLTYHNTGEATVHLTPRSVHDIISESPYKNNHIYHVLDAADFPLSLIPSLTKTLSLNPPRGKNRRAHNNVYTSGRRAELTYIITRADLLAPKKEQVDRLMPYLIQVLRDALGASAENIRLGNVRCVSSKRGWWTKTIKENIWERGGGGWMVGKANVGKSNLFECVFPKGRMELENRQHAKKEIKELGTVPSQAFLPISHGANEIITGLAQNVDRQESFFDLENSLLPPMPTERNFPNFPLVSSLPGTTVAPIRHSFGNGKGELIDLPGLSRGDLQSFTLPEYRNSLVMCQRVKPKQLTIKPGQSLVVGGLIRITPLDSDAVILAYPFLTLPTHVTSTDKAKAMFEQQSFPDSTSVARPGASHRILHAGTFPLKWDVTKDRAGPLTRKDAAGIRTNVLPFIVLSTDILIEGCGWIELVAQVRKRHLEKQEDSRSFFDTKNYPMIEILSPDGKHIGVRRPMNAWLLGGEKSKPARGTSRPRRSMKGVKKRLKEASRDVSGTQ